MRKTQYLRYRRLINVAQGILITVLLLLLVISRVLAL